MIQLKDYIDALKISWIRRLIISESKYKTLFESIYTEVNMLIKRGITYIEKLKMNSTNNFWRDVFDAWHKLILNIKPNTVADMLGINIWDNRNIKINNTTVFYRRWFDKNITFIKDIINDIEIC